MAGRRQQVLDGALRVLGAQGARGLTYQAVDREAGVPPGTTSNHFRTRRALVRAAVEHLTELDRDDWRRFMRRTPGSTEEAVAALAELVRAAAGPGRGRTRARYTLFLEAAADPELAALLAEGRASVAEQGGRWLAALGVPDPYERYRRLAAHLDGAILHRFTFPGEATDPAPGFRAILEGPA